MEKVQGFNTKALHFSNAQILVLGNSHAAVQIDPAVLETQLAATAYNIGVPGYGFDLQKLRYDYYCSTNQKPKLLLLVVANNQFQPTTIITDNRSILPFVSFDGFASRDIPLSGRVYHYLPFIKYNQEWTVAYEGLKNYFSAPSNDRRLYEKGYQGLDRSWQPAEIRKFRDHLSPRDPVINDTVRNRFEHFLHQCHEDGVNVVLIATPEYEESSRRLRNGTAYYSELQAIAEKHGGTFINLVNDPLSRNTKNYADAAHLNKTAARELTKHIADSLQGKGLWP